MEELLGQFSFGLFILQTVLFVGLILLLKKFAWKPILDAVNESEEVIKEAILLAENAKKEMMALKSDNQKLFGLIKKPIIVTTTRERKRSETDSFVIDTL